MENKFSLVVVLTLFISALSFDASALPEFMPGEMIVKFKSQGLTMASSGIQSLNQKYKVAKIEKVFPTAQAGLEFSVSNSGEKNLLPDLSQVYLLKFSKATNILQAVSDYQKDGSVEYAEPNYFRFTARVPNDTYYANGSKWELTKIQAEKAWDFTTGSPETIVAVVDTGADWTHEDLAANIWSNSKEIPDNGIDDDSNGYIDDIRGWNFVSISTDEVYNLGNGISPADGERYGRDNKPIGKNSHGTHVAGSVGAVGNNGKGSVGVMWTSKIMPVRIGFNYYDASYGRDLDTILLADEVAGIRYAADNGAKVINMSFGGGYTSTEADAVAYAYAKGAVLIVAAMNENTEAVYYPAGNEHVIAVASTASNDARASYSNYGAHVAVSAPGGEEGGDILSTVIGGQYEQTNWRGTSMASPVVAGLAGLLLSLNPNLTQTQVRYRITSEADNIDAVNPTFIGKLGTGRVNVYKSISAEVAVSAPQNPEQPPAPTVSISNTYNYPNPFKPSSGQSTTIRFDLSAAQSVKILIFDITGRLVWKKEIAATAGTNNVDWDGKSNFGESLPNDVYLYRILSGTEVLSKGKIVILD